MYEVEGDFIPNEALVFNGLNDGRIATAVTSYSLSDVKSVYGSNDRLTGINTFAADVVQTPVIAVGVATITKVSLVELVP